MTRVPTFTACYHPFAKLAKFAEHPVDYFCHLIFSRGLYVDQRSVYLAIAVSAAWLNYCGLLLLNSVFWCILVVLFAGRELAKNFDNIKNENKKENEKIMATELQVEKDINAESQKRVVSLSFAAFRIPKFALRPSITLKIPSPTLFPRFVATPWLTCA